MLSIKLHHFPFLVFAFRFGAYLAGAAAGGGRASNYQRKADEPRWRHGCLKGGQGPFDSGTTVKRRRLAPIRRM
jgi:hypothetical protein